MHWKTYKQRTIEACEILQYKYSHPQRRTFFQIGFCSLCRIYNIRLYNINSMPPCKGCFQSDKSGEYGCESYVTYMAAFKVLKMTTHGLTSYMYPKDEPTYQEFINRANYFKKIIPILEKIPARRFTPIGWKYFKEISKEW